MVARVCGPKTPSTQQVPVSLQVRNTLNSRFSLLTTIKGRRVPDEYLKSPPFGMVNVVQDGDHTFHRYTFDSFLAPALGGPPDPKLIEENEAKAGDVVEQYLRGERVKEQAFGRGFVQPR